MAYVTWLLPWEWSPVFFLIMLMTGALYWRGAARMEEPHWRRFLFWSGLGTVYFVTQTRFDYGAQHAFFIERIQHTVLHHIGPFLLVWSAPGRTLRSGGPRLHAFGRKFLDSVWIAPLIDTLNRPLPALLLYDFLIGIWLVPRIHVIAMLDIRIYLAMNMGMLVNGLMFWGVMLRNYALRPAAVSPGLRLAVMMAAIPPQIAMGAIIAFTPRELYPIYNLCGRIFPGIGAMADQQLGGLILWPAAMMSILGIGLVLREDGILKRRN